MLRTSLRPWHRPACWLRPYSTLPSLDPALAPTPDPAERKAKAKADWKRRAQGSNFVDTLRVTVASGKGGSGGVAFHREKFVRRGPPAGGNGGVGGSVYLVASPSVSNLSHLGRTVRAGPGGAGRGSWLGGARGEDAIIRVPVGTVVREIRQKSTDEEVLEQEKEERKELEWAYEANRIRMEEAQAREIRWQKWKKRRDQAEKFGDPDDVEAWEELDEEPIAQHKLDALVKLRKALFVMYPGAELDGHPGFLRTEHQLLSKMLSREIDMPASRVKGRFRRNRAWDEEEDDAPLYLDLVKPTPIDDPILLVPGGQPGLGNPSFLTHEDRSPKYATRGGEGDRVIFELEVKSIGEVGLVGLPNAGKSTLLRSLTSSAPRVASYAFTTLNPHHGTCIIWSDGTFSGPRAAPHSSDEAEISDTPSTPLYFSAEKQHASRAERRKHLPADFPRRGDSERSEVLRFTMTDNPGLVKDSSLNVGLGHAFLRHIERCSALVYVVDLSSPDPCGAIRSLRKELREYARMKEMREGELEGRIRGVVANKADLFGPAEAEEQVEMDAGEADVDPAALEEARRKSAEDGRRKLVELMEYVRGVEKEEMEAGIRSPEDPIWVVPISAKKRQNVPALVNKLAETVKKERARAAEQAKAAEEAEAGEEKYEEDD
ncbi:hypothetical protein NBRC10512_005875 [Rhodotorula toruloides]|uniref:RHTO0S10e00254g1_1 n=2 Tax=Rhodotorula toruloides TaxID=5286 RepID=A0A061BA68_RHOTO|nr:GTP binding protein [Rhodotorula toruloides NP11]EMS18546.1 GTP binding protein [Rhodotorula toruloides NP11]CDR44776.1 RHTO0S10e00254g1_1 [Rhodotorula toruloides]